MKALRLILSITVVLISQNILAQTSEPEFCTLDGLKKLEIQTDVKDLERAHVYKIGQLTLVGAAVGRTGIEPMIELSQKFSAYSDYEKYCTWYFNRGDEDSIETFNHHYLPQPWPWLSAKSIGKKYQSILESSYFTDDPSFLSCVVNHKYLAMGCDGMKHRGPSAFAMFLTFAGCAPESSAKIVNAIWGKNTVPKKHRVAMAKEAKVYAEAHPEERAILQGLMGL